MLDLLDEQWLASPGLEWCANSGSSSGEAFTLDTREVMKVSSCRKKKSLFLPLCSSEKA